MHKGHRHKFAFLFLLSLALLNAGSAFAQVDPDDLKIIVQKSPFDSGVQENVKVHTIPDSVCRRVLSDDDYWYANMEQKKKEEKKAAPETDTPKWVKTLTWILIIGIFCGALIWYLAWGNIGLFRKAAKPLSDDEDNPEDEDIFSLDYDVAIGKAVAAGNYRQAIRLHYLGMLKELSDRKLINYTQERTNRDYVDQLHNTSYYRPFFRLTRSFEYGWYGRFAISGDAYAQVRQEFADFKQSLRS